MLRRWAIADPIRGDFELVQLAAGVAVFGFLALGTARRANILVDSLTLWLPARARDALDTLWSLLWAAAALLLAERMSVGARETLRAGTQTMVLGVPTWWAVGLGSAGLALTGAAALLWTWRHASGRAGG